MAFAHLPADDNAARPSPAEASRPMIAAAFAGRDLRIDLLRGLALWMIFIDHIPGNALRLVTYHRLGFSDAAEIFVFLSGVSCSLAYGRVVAKNGVWAGQRRALRRVWQIYVGYLLVAALTFALVLCCRETLGADYITVNDLDLLIAEPLRAFVAAGFLYYTPQYLDILPLYMALVATAPALICALRRNPRLTLSLSAALWLAAAVVPHLRTPNLVPGSFNPLSWQLLFCVGLWAGGYFYGQGKTFHAMRGVVMICVLLIIANVVGRGLYDFGHAAGHFHFALLDALHAASRGGDEGYPRLTHFLAVAYIFAAYGWRRDAPVLQRAWARPLIWCGQHSLEVFCSGVILGDIIAVYFQKMHPNIGHQLLANAAGVAVMVTLAWSLARQRQSAAPVVVRARPEQARAR
jgi:hypothetical protein